VTLRISDFAVYNNISNVFNENSHKYAYKRCTQLKLLIEAPDLGCLKAVTLDVGAK
jgi:hypothetical protein